MSMKSVIFAVASLLLGFAAGSAHGQIIIDPSPSNSIVPTLIRLVGRNGNGAPDTSGQFEVKVRDLATNPVANARIRVTFLPASSARLCTTQGPSVSTVHCDLGLPWVEGTTGADGNWTATLIGCSAGPATAWASGTAEIHADGVLLGFPRVAILDLGGCDGTGANDLSIWLADFSSGLEPQRSDYDGSGALGANDLSLWLSAYGSGASSINCAAAVCP